MRWNLPTSLSFILPAAHRSAYTISCKIENQFHSAAILQARFFDSPVGYLSRSRWLSAELPFQIFTILVSTAHRRWIQRNRVRLRNAAGGLRISPRTLRTCRYSTVARLSSALSGSPKNFIRLRAAHRRTPNFLSSQTIRTASSRACACGVRLDENSSFISNLRAEIFCRLPIPQVQEKNRMHSAERSQESKRFSHRPHRPATGPPDRSKMPPPWPSAVWRMNYGKRRNIDHRKTRGFLSI